MNLVKKLFGKSNKDISKSVTKKGKDMDTLFFECKCGHTHFRHAGYMEVMTPWIDSSGKNNIGNDSKPVHVCVKCKKCYVYVRDAYVDVTNKVDLKAWEKTEVELQKATGPGGEC